MNISTITCNIKQQWTIWVVIYMCIQWITEHVTEICHIISLHVLLSTRTIIMVVGSNDNFRNVTWNVNYIWTSFDRIPRATLVTPSSHISQTRQFWRKQHHLVITMPPCDNNATFVVNSKLILVEGILYIVPWSVDIPSPIFLFKYGIKMNFLHLVNRPIPFQPSVAFFDATKHTCIKRNPLRVRNLPCNKSICALICLL